MFNPVEIMEAVDYLLLVSDTSAKAVKVAETIKRVAFKHIGEIKAGLLINRVHSEEEVEQITSHTSLEVIGWVPEDGTIRRFDEKNLSFFSLTSCPASEAVIKALARAGILD